MKCGNKMWVHALRWEGVVWARGDLMLPGGSPRQAEGCCAVPRG